MHETQNRYTVSDLLAIFDVSSTALYRHLNQNELKDKLIDHGHLVTKDHRTYFDGTGVLSLARTFESRKANNSHNTKKHKFNGKRKLNTLIKKVTLMENQLTRISNKLGIYFTNDKN